ncbi:MAG: putative DNA binding domain-containing protein [Myxococcota bacterium]|nr:putative DNA binding domain-containing protein [Myxococcota bacterium]
MTTKLPINLQSLLRKHNVEDERIEFKRGWNPDAIIRTVCAFANDFSNLGGGYVVVGQDCDENGQPISPPVGLDESQLDKIQQEMIQYANQIQPPYFPVLSIEEVEGKKLIVLWAPGGLHRPYKAPKNVTAKHKEHRYYIRRYASTIEAKGEDEQELLSLTAIVPFDDRLNQFASVDDLSTRLMEEFLKEVGSNLANEAKNLSVEALGRRMNVVDGPTENPMPKNVGLLFFNEEPDKFFPVTQIDVVFFPEDAGGDRFEEKVFKGPIHRITQDAISFIERNYLKQTIIKYPDRPEADRLWNFPLAAIEEAVVNAVYHRSYEIREPVEIRISPEDLVVLSFPGPDRSIRMDDLRVGKGVSRRYRNRRIGELLKELELTEGRSTGIKKILRAMERNGSAAPEFDTDEDRSYFMLRLPVHPHSLDASTVETSEPQLGAQPGTKSALSRHQVEILKKCRDSAPLIDLIAISGRTDRTKFKAQVLNPLLEAGLIEMTIPDKPTSRLQKYRLTTAGKAALELERGKSSKEE